MVISLRTMTLVDILMALIEFFIIISYVISPRVLVPMFGPTGAIDNGSASHDAAMTPPQWSRGP